METHTTHYVGICLIAPNNLALARVQIMAHVLQYMLVQKRAVKEVWVSAKNYPVEFKIEVRNCVIPIRPKGGCRQGTCMILPATTPERI